MNARENPMTTPTAEREAEEKRKRCEHEFEYVCAHGCGAKITDTLVLNSIHDRKLKLQAHERAVREKLEEHRAGLQAGSIIQSKLPDREDVKRNLDQMIESIDEILSLFPKKEKGK